MVQRGEYGDGVERMGFKWEFGRIPHQQIDARPRMHVDPDAIDITFNELIRAASDIEKLSSNKRQNSLHSHFCKRLPE